MPKKTIGQYQLRTVPWSRNPQLGLTYPPSFDPQIIALAPRITLILEALYDHLVNLTIAPGSIFWKHKTPNEQLVREILVGHGKGFIKQVQGQEYTRGGPRGLPEGKRVGEELFEDLEPIETLKREKPKVGGNYWRWTELYWKTSFGVLIWVIQYVGSGWGGWDKELPLVRIGGIPQRWETYWIHLKRTSMADFLKGKPQRHLKQMDANRLQTKNLVNVCTQWSMIGEYSLDWPLRMLVDGTSIALGQTYKALSEGKEMNGRYANKDVPAGLIDTMVSGLQHLVESVALVNTGVLPPGKDSEDLAKQLAERGIVVYTDKSKDWKTFSKVRSGNDHIPVSDPGNRGTPAGNDDVLQVLYDLDPERVVRVDVPVDTTCARREVLRRDVGKTGALSQVDLSGRGTEDELIRIMTDVRDGLFCGRVIELPVGRNPNQLLIATFGGVSGLGAAFQEQLRFVASQQPNNPDWESSANSELQSYTFFLPSDSSYAFPRTSLNTIDITHLERKAHRDEAAGMRKELFVYVEFCTKANSFDEWGLLGGDCAGFEVLFRKGTMGKVVGRLSIETISPADLSAMARIVALFRTARIWLGIYHRDLLGDIIGPSAYHLENRLLRKDEIALETDEEDQIQVVQKPIKKSRRATKAAGRPVAVQAMQVVEIAVIPAAKPATRASKRKTVKEESRLPEAEAIARPRTRARSKFLEEAAALEAAAAATEGEAEQELGETASTKVAGANDSQGETLAATFTAAAAGKDGAKEDESESPNRREDMGMQVDDDSSHADVDMGEVLVEDPIPSPVAQPTLPSTTFRIPASILEWKHVSADEAENNRQALQTWGREIGDWMKVAWLDRPVSESSWILYDQNATFGSLGYTEEYIRFYLLHVDEPLPEPLADPSDRDLDRALALARIRKRIDQAKGGYLKIQQDANYPAEFPDWRIRHRQVEAAAVIDFTECYHPPPSLSSLQPRLDFVLSKEATADEDDKTLFKVEHTDGLDTFYHYP